jgi:hypothetical protein
VRQLRAVASIPSRRSARAASFDLPNPSGVCTHMDRGCMGLAQADDDRIAARLRKMVGKNIGIMYFGLELSADPARCCTAASASHRNWMR